jgi:hypothetical protein
MKRREFPVGMRAQQRWWRTGGQPMQRVSMTMNIADKIVPLDSH